MIQIVSFRPRGKKIAWYVCRGIPRFTSPSQQIKNVILATFAHCELHLPTRTDIVLKNKLEYISQLQQSKYMSINTVNDNDNSELMNNDLSIDFTTDREVNNTNAPEIIRINTPTKYKITQQRISVALRLDLKLYPRPSRDNSTTISLHHHK